MQNIKGKQIAFCGLFIALFAISSKIQIPTALVPITLQTAVLLLCVTTLSGFWSTFSVSVYIFCGLLGLPVFANGGGFSYFLNPTFGYLLGFLLVTLLRVFFFKNLKNTYKNYLIFYLIAIFTVHFLGTFYCYFIYNLHLGEKISLIKTFVFSSLIFIPTDLIWCITCPIISLRINKAINL